MTDILSNIFLVIAIVVGVIVYFIPSYLARDKENFKAVLFVNLLFGASILGWALALVWAITGEKLPVKK